jgi:hypothetical protein
MSAEGKQPTPPAMEIISIGAEFGSGQFRKPRLEWILAQA